VRLMQDIGFEEMDPFGCHVVLSTWQLVIIFWGYLEDDDGRNFHYAREYATTH
jgi:hypothetical protein